MDANFARESETLIASISYLSAGQLPFMSAFTIFLLFGFFFSLDRW